jgi:ribosome recycling factor
MFNTKPYEDKMKAAIEHFEAEAKKIRTGRAHPGMLEGVMIEAYGTQMPLNQVGNVTVVDATLLQVTPFDPGNLPQIVAGIRDNQSLGLNPSDDGRVVRVPIPPLTEERRQEMVKQLKNKAEEAKISLRNARHDGIKEVRKMKDDKEISEDEQARMEKALDAAIEQHQNKLAAVEKAKEQDIMTV